MLLIPGLELRNGHVALPNLDANADEHLLFRDAVQTVGELYARGARRFHLMDADGASAGEPANIDRILQIKQAYPDSVLEVTGGMRKIEHAELWLDVGADFVVLTWKMLRDPQITSDLCTEYPGRVIVSLEGHDGVIGNGNGVSKDGTALVAQYADQGVSAVLYTEQRAPGQHVDPLAPAARLAEAADIPVLCNGGLHDLDTVARLRKAPLKHLAGVLMGRALLNGSLDYADALAALKKR